MKPLNVVIFFFAIVFAGRAVVVPGEIKQLYVVWSNHFDAGFTLPLGTLANEYFRFFTAAINTSATLRARGGDEQYIWSTEAPWLIDFYLRGCETSLFPTTFAALNCPTSSQRQALIDEIALGGIAWAAMPFSAEPEFASDPRMFTAALDFVHRLDTLVGRSKHSAVFSQRDVPGLTVAALPLLRRAGVRAVSVGVNGGSAPPAVPKNTPFVWRDPASGASVIAFWHPGGYGGIGSGDVVSVDGYPFALATAWKGDNLGPHTVKEVLAVYSELHKTFPNAKIITTTFDGFLDVLEANVPKDKFQVVTGEIGDTWIHGVEADPQKTARLQAAIRLRAECVASGNIECTSGNEAFLKFDRLLLKGIEHTWGVDTKMYLHDFTHWSNDALAKERRMPIFQNMEKTWLEQRQFLDNAVIALGNTSALASRIRTAWSQMHPILPNPKLEGFSLVTNPATAVFNCSSVILQFDDKTGAINRFFVPATGTELASSSRLLGSYKYQTFTEEDFLAFLSKYMYEQPPPLWAQLDFGKLGCKSANPEHKTFDSRLKELWFKMTAGGQCSFLAHTVFEEEAFIKYGAPRDVWVGIDVAATENPYVGMQLMLFNKTSTRLPESHWLAFQPNVDARDGRLTVTKLGEPVDVFDVIKNGSTHMHSVDTSSKQHVLFRDADTQQEISFCSPDAPLVFIGKDLSPFPVPLDPDQSSDKTIAFNLCNNIWGTNYPMWIPFASGDEDMLFRFSLSISN